jgi:uncharacterized membrane protein
VIIMVEAHVTDAWTRDADRHGQLYFNAVFVAGLAAPLFLFLAGVSMALATSARARRQTHTEAAAAARARGWQILGLALLFRLQSQLLGWGPLVNLLKVDILNVMGLALVAAGVLWGWGRSRPARLLLFSLATAAMTMATPLVREWHALDWLPDLIEWYLRPAPNRATFALFPWAGFLFAGAVLGELAASMRRGADGRMRDASLHTGLAVTGLASIGLGYFASLQPSVYPVSSFWTSSPTFFIIRLGIVVCLVPLARMAPSWTALETLGRSSLFVYWIHVEMVYGALAKPLKHALPLEGSLAATALLCVLLYAIVLWKNRAVQRGWQLPSPIRILTPVLKS